MKKRVLSIILCMVMLFSATALPATAVSHNKNTGVISAVVNGYPMKNLADIIKGIYQINKFINYLTGVPILTEETLVLTVDETVQSIVDNIVAKKGVDFGQLYSLVPSFSRSAELITSALKVNIPVLNDELNKVALLLNEAGNPALASVVGLLRVWLSVVDGMQIQLNPVAGQPGVYSFDALVTYRDGRTELCKSNILYDSNKNEICGADGAPALLGFSVDLNQVYSYTGINVWQRNFGFCMEYDLFCFLTPYLMNYVTQRIKFVYDNREWMCQLWKGTYFITNGGEVGFYTRPIGSIGTFYRCVGDEDMMDMTLQVYHRKDLLLSRGPVKHWWVTGFSVDDVCYVPSTLTLVTTITMKDKEMLNAFTKALKKKRLVLDYKVDGLDVTIKW